MTFHQAFEKAKELGLEAELVPCSWPIGKEFTRFGKSPNFVRKRVVQVLGPKSGRQSGVKQNWVAAERIGIVERKWS